LKEDGNGGELPERIRPTRLGRGSIYQEGRQIEIQGMREEKKSTNKGIRPS